MQFTELGLKRWEKSLCICLGMIICIEVGVVCIKWAYPFQDYSLEIILDIGAIILITLFSIGTVRIIMRIVSNKRFEPFEHQKEQVQSIFKMLQVLVPVVERKSQTTSEEIEQLAKLMKRMMKYYPEECIEDWEIHLIAYLLYISRIKLPDYLFVKQEKLSPYEYIHIQEHCLIAKEFLEDEPIFKHVIEVITHHHERVDGTGYPTGLQSNQIPLMSRLLYVVESYVAMTTPRSYRNLMTQNQALEELLNHAGSAYDSRVVKEFINEISLYTREEELHRMTIIM